MTEQYESEPAAKVRRLCNACEEWRDFEPTIICSIFQPSNVEALLRVMKNKKWFDARLREGFFGEFLSGNMLLALTDFIISHNCECSGSIEKGAIHDRKMKKRTFELEEQSKGRVLTRRWEPVRLEELLKCFAESQEMEILRKVFAAMRGTDACAEMIRSVEFKEICKGLGLRVIWDGTLDAFLAGGFGINNMVWGFCEWSLMMDALFHRRKFEIERLVKLGADVNMHTRFTYGKEYSAQSFAIKDFGEPKWSSDILRIIYRYATMPSLFVHGYCIDSAIYSKYLRRKWVSGEEIYKQLIEAYIILSQCRMSFFARAMHPRLGAQCVEPLREFVSNCHHLMKYIATIICADEVNSISPEAFTILCEKWRSDQFDVP